MEAKHTPGPWRFDDAGPLSGNITRFDVLSGSKTAPFRVCEIDDSAADVSLSKRKAAAARDLANARLIAAAPALLEACKRAVHLYDHDDATSVLEWVNSPEFRSAIRQAEGGGE